MVANRVAGDSWAQLGNDACAFVPHDKGQRVYGAVTVDAVIIAVADTAANQLDLHLPLFRVIEVQLLDL